MITTTTTEQLRARFDEMCTRLGTSPRSTQSDEIASETSLNESASAAEKIARIYAWCDQRNGRPGIKSETASPVRFECAGFTGLNEKRVEKEKETPTGYGKRWRNKVKRDRIRRLRSPANLAKAKEARARNRYHRIVQEDGLRSQRSQQIYDVLREGGSYNGGVERLEVSIAEFRGKSRTFKTNKNAYLLNAKARLQRSEGRREWNENRLLFLAAIGRPATTGLSAPEPRRSEAEAAFELFVHSQLLPLQIAYPETDTPHDCNDLFVGWDGHFYAGVRDYDIDDGDSKLQVQVKGIANLFYRARDTFKKHCARRYRALRTDLFNLLLRVHQNRVFCEFADIELRPVALVSATSARSWYAKSEKGKRLKDKDALVTLLEKETDYVLEYLLDFARAVYPKEYAVLEHTIEQIERLASSTSDESKINLCELLELYRDVLAESKAELRYSGSFASDYFLANTTCWHEIKAKLPKRFTRTKFEAASPFTLARQQEPSRAILARL